VKSRGVLRLDPDAWEYMRKLHGYTRTEMEERLAAVLRAKTAAEDEALRREAWELNAPLRDAARRMFE